MFLGLRLLVPPCCAAFRRDSVWVVLCVGPGFAGHFPVCKHCANGGLSPLRCRVIIGRSLVAEVCSRQEYSWKGSRSVEQQCADDLRSLSSVAALPAGSFAASGGFLPRSEQDGCCAYQLGMVPFGACRGGTVGISPPSGLSDEISVEGQPSAEYSSRFAPKRE